MTPSRRALALAAAVLIVGVRTAAAQPTGTKEETVYYEILWNGSVSGGDAEVSLRLSNPGESNETVSVCDRLWFGDARDVRPLLGSRPPDLTFEIPGGYSLCWRSIPVGAGGEVEIRYGARTNLSLPAEVSISILINGEPADPEVVEGRPYLPVSPGDEIEVSVTLLNTLPRRTTDLGVGRPPLGYNLQLSIKRDSFTEPDSDPAPAMVLPSGDSWILSWFGVLWDDPETISMRFRLRPSVPLGVEDFPDLTVQLSTDTSSVADQLEEAAERYNESLRLLLNMSDRLQEMRDSLFWLASGLEGARRALTDSRSGLRELADGLRRAAVGEERAADEVGRVRGYLADVLDRMDSLGSTVDRVIEANRDLLSKLKDLLSQFNLSITLPGGGISDLISSMRSQLSAARGRAAATISTLARMESTLRNASVSLSEAAEAAEAALDNLTILDSSLESAASAARYGASISDEAISNMTERMEDLNSTLSDLRLRSELARLGVPFLGPAEVDPPDPGVVEVVPRLSREGGSWVVADLILPNSTVPGGVLSSLSILSGDGGGMYLQANCSGSWTLAEFPPWWSSPGELIVIPLWNLSGAGGGLLGARGYRVLIPSSTRPSVRIEADLVRGRPMEVRTRMVVSVDSPDLAVGLNLSEPKPPAAAAAEGDRDGEVEGGPSAPVLLLTSLAAAGVAALGYRRIRAGRERERTRLLSELERLRVEVDLLIEEVREKLGEG